MNEYQARPLPTPMKRSLSSLSFARLRHLNVQRCELVFHDVDEWSPTDWATALAGEVGEACNLIKKQRRGDPIDIVEIGHELADAVAYLDLLAARLGLDLGECVRSKFNIVSQRMGLTDEDWQL